MFIGYTFRIQIGVWNSFLRCNISHLLCAICTYISICFHWSFCAPQATHKACVAITEIWRALRARARRWSLHSCRAPAYGSNIYARGRLAASGIYSPQKPNGKVALARIAIINVWVKYKWQLGNEKSGGFGSGAAKTTPKAILLYGVILDCNLCGIFSLF